MAFVDLDKITAANGALDSFTLKSFGKSCFDERSDRHECQLTELCLFFIEIGKCDDGELDYGYSSSLDCFNEHA